MFEKEIQFGKFVDKLAGLAAQSDASPQERNAFLHMALTGQENPLTPENNPTQYSVLFDRHRLSAPHAAITQHVRDYDSLLGYSSSLPYSVDLSLHLIAQPIYQLKSTLHVYIDRNLVEPIMVSLSPIPPWHPISYVMLREISIPVWQMRFHTFLSLVLIPMG